MNNIMTTAKDNTWTLKEIVSQLEFCKYTDEHGHVLERNAAFVDLKQKANEEHLVMPEYMGEGMYPRCGVHVIEISLQYGKYSGTIYATLGGNIGGSGAIQTIASYMEDDPCELNKPDMQYMNRERQVINEKHAVYDSEGYLEHIVLYSNEGSTMIVEDIGRQVTCMRVVQWLESGRRFNK